MTMTEEVTKPIKKRGRPVGAVYRHEPYFPDKVEKVRKMRAQGISYTEIGREIGMTPSGVGYLWKRWIEPTIAKG